MEFRCVASWGGDDLPQKKSLGEFSLPVPAVLASQGPDRLGSSLRACIFFDEPLPEAIAHFVADGSSMFAAQPESLKQTLTDGGNVELQLPHAIIAQRRLDRGMSGR